MIFIKYHYTDSESSISTFTDNFSFIDENTLLIVEKYRISDLFNGAIPVDEFNLEVKLNSIEIIMVDEIDSTNKTKEYNGSWEFEVPVKKDLSESKNIDIKNIDLNVNIGTEDAGITAILVGILAGILGIIIKKPKYQILPIYANRNLLKINLNGIFTIYLMHYIYKFIKDNIKERFMDK